MFRFRFKLFTVSFMTMFVVMAHSLFAGGVSNTAQTLGSVGSIDWVSLVNLVKAIIYAAITAVPAQALLELLITHFMPIWMFPLKGFLPIAVSSVCGTIATHMGVSADDAIAGGLALAGFIHWANAQPWALELESKYPNGGKIWTAIGSAVTSTPPAAKVGALLIGLLLMSGVASASPAIALSDSGVFGSSTWTVGQGGGIVPTGGTIVGDEVNLGLGSLDATGVNFTDYAMVCVGGALESRNGTQYADLLLGIGTLVPSTNANVVLGPAWRLFTGAKYPDITLAVNFQFGNPFFTHKISN